MMLFNLALKNIKKSFKDYAIYFFTLILGITIFYSFNSLETQAVMLKKYFHMLLKCLVN